MTEAARKIASAAIVRCARLRSPPASSLTEDAITPGGRLAGHGQAGVSLQPVDQYWLVRTRRIREAIPGRLRHRRICNGDHLSAHRQMRMNTG